LGPGGLAFRTSGIAGTDEWGGTDACRIDGVDGSDPIFVAELGPFSVLAGPDPEAPRLETTTSSVAAMAKR
jgi:hypothetical protein